jgi:hypothetical protein
MAAWQKLAMLAYGIKPDLVTPDALQTDGNGALKIAGNPTGTPTYDAKASGTINVPVNNSTIAITAHSTTGGSVTIGGRASIPLPANGQFFDGATRYPGAIAIVFTGTDQCYVSWSP